MDIDIDIDDDDYDYDADADADTDDESILRRWHSCLRYLKISPTPSIDDDEYKSMFHHWLSMH